MNPGVVGRTVRCAWAQLRRSEPRRANDRHQTARLTTCYSKLISLLRTRALILCLLGILFPDGTFSQETPPRSRWAVRQGGTNAEVVYGIAADSAGNVIVAGYFYGPPGSIRQFGGVTFTNGPAADGEEILVAKLNGSGNVLWAKRAGDTSIDVAKAVAVDSAGNAYVTGRFSGANADFDSFHLAVVGGNTDIFVAKYSPTGAVQWVRQMGVSRNFLESGNGIATDALGNLYVTGFFGMTNGAFRSFTLTNTWGSACFVVRMDSSGNVIWARQAVGPASSQGEAIAVDPNGNVFVTGSFQQTNVTFGSVTLTNRGGISDLFLVKYD